MSAEASVRGQVRVALTQGWRDAVRGWGPRAWASVAVFGVAAALPLVISSPATLARLASALYIALAAVGLNAAVGFSGMPVLAQGAFAAAGAFTTAWLRTKAGWDIAPATVVGVAVALGAGAAVGAVRMRGVFVAVATWLVAWMTAFFLTAFPSISGGSQGLVLPVERVNIPGTGVGVELAEGWHFELALGLLGVALLGFLAMSRGPTGLAMAAVRAGPSLSSSLGVRTNRLQFGALVAAAGIAGLAGSLSVQLAGVADPTAYGPLLSIELFIAVLLGGEGRILGPVVGAAILAAIPGTARALGSLASVGIARFEPVLASALLVVGLLLGRGGVLRIAEEVAHRLGYRSKPRADLVPHERAVTIAPRNGPEILEATDLSKHFGGVDALVDVSFNAEPGVIHALIGPNGSGKTTLLRLLGGTFAPDSGRVILAERDVTAHSVEDRVREGVVRTLQRTAILEELQPLEHVMAGATASRSYGGALRTLLSTPLSRAETREVKARAAAILELIGIDPATGTVVGRLPAGEQRLTMVATAAASLPSVLLLDEPASGLTSSEDQRLEAFLRSLAGAGTAIVMVEHDFPLVARVANLVTVLDAGRVIAEGTPEQVRRLRVVREAYLGAGH